MNYEIIKKEQTIYNFINEYLPDLQSGETYFIRLITRSKYVKHIKYDTELKHYIINKEDIITSIKQLECEIGNYLGVDNDGLGIYININPRSFEVYMKKTFIRYSDIIGNYKNQDLIDITINNWKSSCSRKIYHDIDFDKVNVYETMDNVLNYINHSCVSTLPSKSGVHFLINLDKVDLIKYPDWHENIKKIKGYDGLVSKIGDNMIPIPGCNMFGFVPEFIK